MAGRTGWTHGGAKAGSAGRMVTGAGGFFASRVPSGFTSKADPSEFLGAIELPLGSGIAESTEAIAAASEALRGVEHVKNIFLTAGAGSRGEANIIDLYASITRKQERRIGQFDVIEEARREAVPEASEITVSEVPWFSGGGVSTGDIELVIPAVDGEWPRFADFPADD